MCSVKVNRISLTCHKSDKAFGPVGHCVNSISTGIPLSCHMGHHGENTIEIIKANLQIIKQTNNPEKMTFDGTLLFGDRGYNKEKYFYLKKEVGLGFVHTTKRGPFLCFIFGTVNYKTSREHQCISENGPMLSIGATSAIVDTKSHLVLYSNGTGHVAILQSSDPSLAYSNIEYVTMYSDIDYATTYSKILMNNQPTWIILHTIQQKTFHQNNMPSINYAKNTNCIQ